jgi:NAD(P)-dependent dehydrogenase (short-subunit alcohol dehydrogenase family)
MHIELNDQVALVTGAAHRVGKAIALALAQCGVHLLIHYNRAVPDQLRDTLHEIKSFGVDAFAIQADLARPEGIESIMTSVQENFGRLNILVNSASVFPSAHLMDITLDSWDETFNVNLRAPFLLTQRAARFMRQNKPSGGVIINICDRGVDRPWPSRPHHGVSKAALWALTQVSAVSLAPDIRVNAIVPGPVMKTNDGMSDEQWQQIGQMLPLKRTGEGGDVGRAVVYLAQEDFLTGTLIHVNGGEHL